MPIDKLENGLEAICGRCKRPFPVKEEAFATKPIEVTDATFAAEVERSPIPVMLDMWAPWCGPCRMISPVLEDLAREMAGRVRVAKLNVDENPATAGRFKIQSIPALLLLKGGREIDRIIGVQPKSEIRRRVQHAIA